MDEIIIASRWRHARTGQEGKVVALLADGRVQLAVRAYGRGRWRRLRAPTDRERFFTDADRDACPDEITAQLKMLLGHLWIPDRRPAP